MMHYFVGTSGQAPPGRARSTQRQFRVDAGRPPELVSRIDGKRIADIGKLNAGLATMLLLLSLRTALGRQLPFRSATNRRHLGMKDG